MTNSVLMLFVAFVGGLGLGLLHFGGLWMTVRHLPAARQPGLCTLGSSVGRLGLSVLGLSLAVRAGWLSMLVCLGGFLVMRTVLISRWRPTRPQLSA